MSGFVAAPDEYSKRNEAAFRLWTEDELATVFRKGQDLIIPYGTKLGFAGTNGQQVDFKYDSGSFQIVVDGVTVVSFTSSADFTTLQSEVIAARQGEASLTAKVTQLSSATATVDGKLNASYSLTVDVNGRIASMKLLSDGTTTDIVFTASTFQIYDGVTERPLFSAGSGIVTVNGDVAVGGAIVVGSARLKLALESIEFSKGDGDTISWANGVSIGTAPRYLLDSSACNPLASGERYDVRLTSVTNTGATLYAKIITPGSTSGQTATTDSSGGGGDPDRVMDKPTSGDAYDSNYSFRIQGTITVGSFYEPELGAYITSGSVSFSTWFNDGGGWDEGATITYDHYSLDGSDISGSLSIDLTTVIPWTNAVGQHGGKEFGVSLESGGSITDFVSVAYTTQSSSGTRSATPSGEKVKVSVFPRNA